MRIAFLVDVIGPVEVMTRRELPIMRAVLRTYIHTSRLLQEGEEDTKAGVGIYDRHAGLQTTRPEGQVWSS
jgi:hypothetical protein